MASFQKRRVIGRTACALSLIAATLVGVAAQPVAAAPPSNDDFADAQFIFAGSAPQTTSNVDATIEVGEPTMSCSFQGDALQSSVWWKFNPSSGKPLLISTVGSAIDTQLGIYTGTSLNDLVEVACDDDNQGTDRASRVFHPDPGVDYYIQVDGFAGVQGNIQVSITELECGGTWQVDGAGSGNFTELQDGLAAAAACPPVGGGVTEVHVAQGTYDPTEPGGPRSASFVMEESIRVTGGFPSGFAGPSDPVTQPTILSGSINDAYHVVEASGSRAELVGLTIRDGMADGNVAGQQSGAGIYVTNGVLEVVDSIITANTAIDSGAAIEHSGFGVELIRSTVNGNSGDGAAVRLDTTGNVTVSQTAFFDNPGVFASDLDVTGSTNARVNNSTFESTTAASLVVNDARVRVMNSIVQAGGSPTVRALVNADVELNNSVLTGPSSPGLSVESASAEVLVRNSIIWDVNTAVTVGSDTTGLDFQDSIVQGSGGSASWDTSLGTDLGGNLDTDPLWVDPNNDNFRLLNGSPAIDAGEDSGLPLDFEDLDNDGQTNTEKVPDLDVTDRIKNGTVDMGPFERAPVPCQPIIYVDGDAVNGAQDGLTWADAFTDLQDGIAQANACAGVAFQIWVAEGVYTPHASDRTVRFSLPHQVQIIGGFDATENELFDRPFPLRDVVLSGDLNFDDAPGAFPGSTTPGPDNSQGVVVVERDTVATLLDVTVSGGNADGANGGRADGGGIEIESGFGAFASGSLTVMDVTVANNFALNHGGGILAGGDLFTIGGSVGLNRTDGDGGGIMSTGGITVLQFTAMSLNTAGGFGGGVRSSGAAALNLINSDLSSNSSTNDGGAVYTTSNTNIAGSTFKLNSSGSDGGAIYANSSSLSIVASEFSGNNASALAGAILVSAPNSVISSSSFTTNSAVVAGGAILVDSQPTTLLNIDNSIFWDNSAPAGPEIVNDNVALTSIRRSIVEGSGGSGAGWDPGLGFDLGGNIDADPLFTNTNTFDLTPLPGSPAIGAGDAAVMGRDSFDRDGDGDNLELAPDFVGEDRVQGNGPEIGSRELPDGAPGPVQALAEPCVVYDSTLAGLGLAGPMDGGEVRTISVAGLLPASQGGSTSCVPDHATAATLLIAANSPVREGNFRLSKAGTAPSGGVVNFAPNGLENANTVTVPLSANGQIDLGANGGPQGAGLPLAGVRLVVLAYHSPLASHEFVPVTPCAIADSRTNQGATGSFVGPFTDGAVYPAIEALGAFPAGQGGGNTSCNIPTTADAVVVNVVAINPSGGTGRILIGADGTAPSEGTPFAPLGMNNAAVAVVPISGDGTLDVDIEAAVGASAHVRLVVLGYHQNVGDSLFVPVNPCAAFDTRSTQGSFGEFTGLRQGGQTTTYEISGLINSDQGGASESGSCGVPTNATGVLINLVAINSVGEGNLQISAAGESPTGGVLNFADLTPNMNNANAVPVALSSGGAVDVFVNGGPNGNGVDRTHIRGVVLGYYIAAPIVIN